MLENYLGGDTVRTSNAGRKIVLLLGSGRSGTTLVNLLLGSFDDAMPVGELRQIWSRGILNDELCGCGARFSHCSRWSQVLKHAQAKYPAWNAKTALTQAKKYDRLRSIPLLLIGRGTNDPGLASYLEHLRVLYSSLFETMDVNVLVDSSKSPSHAILVSMAVGCEVHFVHVVRDPRGVRYSVAKRKERMDASDGTLMRQYGTTQFIWSWLNSNIAASFVAKKGTSFQRVRYEEFAHTDRHIIGRIRNQVGLPKEYKISSKGKSNHLIAGNPMKLNAEFMPKVQIDEEWKERLSKVNKFWVTVTTFPLLLKYGYPVVLRKGRVGK